jgi:hypothetical protein
MGLSIRRDQVVFVFQSMSSNKQSILGMLFWNESENLRETTKRNDESPNLRRLILHLLAILLLLLLLDRQEPGFHDFIGVFLH